MTQEEKQLLLKDLSARLPYDVIVDYESHIYVLNEIDPACKDIDYITVRIQDVERLMCAKSVMIENIIPYLRPMSSMTEEEEAEYYALNAYEGAFPHNEDALDYVLEHHFDFRGLIEKGLALEAPEGMYNKN